MLAKTTSVGLVFTCVVLFAAFASAQTATKIAIVDTDAFYNAKDGVTKIMSAYKVLEIEFKPAQTEIENLGKRLQSIQSEIQALQNQANDPKNSVPIDKNAAQAKVDEYERLQRDLKNKQEDAKARYGKREASVIGPIIEDVGKALGDYAKQKGYTMVFDIGKMFDQRLIVYWDETPDITKGFIQYYNARPAGSDVPKP